MQIMGIINCTPDSFFSGSRRAAVDEAVETALAMEQDGADILDIGGESTRPGARYIPEDEELERVLPVIQGIRKHSRIPLSVDTRKSAVARKTLEAGADIINDISALQDDENMAGLVKEAGARVVLMHKQGIPENMQEAPHYDDPVREIAAELQALARNAEEQGIPAGNIILDPGIGFGKRHEDNLAILRNLKVFRDLGYPLLMGLSRKSFLGKILNNQPDERLAGTLAAHACCLFQGVDILRVHDVKETWDLREVFKEIMWTG